MKKTVKDLKVGDKVWVYGSEVRENVNVYYVCSISISGNTYYLGYGRWYDKESRTYICPPDPSNPKQTLVQTVAYSNDTSTSFGMYAASVYLNIQDVLDRFKHDAESLEQRKQQFIKENKLENETN